MIRVAGMGKNNKKTLKQRKKNWQISEVLCDAGNQRSMLLVRRKC